MPTKNEMTSSREECVVVFEMHVVSLSGAFHDELQVGSTSEAMQLGIASLSK